MSAPNDVCLGCTRRARMPARLPLLAIARCDAPRGRRAIDALAACDGGSQAEPRPAAILPFAPKALSERVYLAPLGPRIGRRVVAGGRALPDLQRPRLDPADSLRARFESAASRSRTDLAAAARRARLDRIEHRAAHAGHGNSGRFQRTRRGTPRAAIPCSGRPLVALDVAFPGDDSTARRSRALDACHRVSAFVAATSRGVSNLARREEARFALASRPSRDPGSARHARRASAWSRLEQFPSDRWKADAEPDPVERVVLGAR